jgi:ribosomal protein L22
MIAEHAHESLERLQPRTHGRAHPFLQVVVGVR